MTGKNRARTGQVLAARTYAELSAVTADIPGAPGRMARPPSPGPERRARPTCPRCLGQAAVTSGSCLAVAAVLAHSSDVIVNGLDYGPAGDAYLSWARVLILLALALAVTALVILGRGVAASVERRRSRKKLPPRPGPWAARWPPHRATAPAMTRHTPATAPTRPAPTYGLRYRAG